MLKQTSAPARDLFRLLCASALIVLAAAALNFVVDPLQIFRPARWFPAMYSPDSRMQDAGLIRSQDFDTVFMGTSLAIHFRQSDIDRLLGVHSLKLALNGSSSVEQTFVLAAALEQHPRAFSSEVETGSREENASNQESRAPFRLNRNGKGSRRVLWEVDDWIFHDAPDIDSNSYLPADLYRRNTRGIAEYLLSGAMARESLWILARSIPPLEPVVARLTNGVMFKFPLSRVDDINALRPDFDIAAAYNADKAIAAFRYITAPVRRSYLADDSDYAMRVRVFERDAIGLIERHPDVRFDIYLPPYSILQWVAMREASPGTLKSVYDFSAYFSRRLTQFPNVTLHDFRAVKEITHDLNNYADVVHHSPVVDLKVLEMLAGGKYVVDPAAPLATLDRLKAQVEAYRVEDIKR